DAKASSCDQVPHTPLLARDGNRLVYQTGKEAEAGGGARVIPPNLGAHPTEGRLLSSNPTRFVIIGNGAAGTYCAEQLRKDDAAAEIVMIDDEKYTLYNRVSLPRYLKG